MNIYELRNQVDSELIDYNQLQALLRSYAYPRSKINRWLQSGDLIRVKKGLYIFGEAVRQRPYDLEILANLIYGPSAISLNYALSYYGLIPERVHTITSITNKRNKVFNTPVGNFTYTYLNPKKYAIDIELKLLPNKSHFLMASPEKALCDLIALGVKNAHLTSIDDFEAFLFEDLRIDDNLFQTLSFSRIKQIAMCYRSKRLNQFIKFLDLWTLKNE